MPLHAAVAHLVVILAPLSAFVALAYTLRTASRRRMRWPLVLGSMLSTGVVLEQALTAVWTLHPYWK